MRSDASGIRTCPSAPAKEGSSLLGLVNGEGTLTYLNPPLVLDTESLAVLRTRPSPERRFRFAAPCIQDSCAQWHAGSCGIIKFVIRNVERASDTGPLPRCGIRSTCRWFAQEGRRACAVCPLVVTDQTPAVIDDGVSPRSSVSAT